MLTRIFVHAVGGPRAQSRCGSLQYLRNKRQDDESKDRPEQQHSAVLQNAHHHTYEGPCQIASPATRQDHAEEKYEHGAIGAHITQRGELAEDRDAPERAGQHDRQVRAVQPDLPVEHPNSASLQLIAADKQPRRHPADDQQRQKKYIPMMDSVAHFSRSLLSQP